MYNVLTYFLGKVTAEIPTFFIFPTIVTILSYFFLGLSTDPISTLIVFWFIGVSIWFAGSALGLTIGAAVPSKAVAVQMIPVVLIPFMLFSGFFVNQNNIPFFLKPFQYVSIFKYGMQAFFQNEYENIDLTCENDPTPCDPLGDYDSPESLWLSIGLIWATGFFFYAVAFVILFVLSKRYH